MAVADVTATAAQPPASEFAPVRVLELDLQGAAPDLQPPTRERPHASVLVLARLHSVPLGAVEMAIPADGLSGQTLTCAARDALAEQIDAHIAADGNGPVPACEIARREFLVDAPRLTVLIPSRERPERLRRCVESIFACDYPADRFSILVVDNAPVTDATKSVVAELAGQSGGRIVYIREDAPGSASARNRGLREVVTELVAMTDDDVIVDRHWLTEIARAFVAHPEAAAVSGLLFPAELETPAQLWFEQYGGFTRGFDRRVFDLVENRPSGEPLYPWNAGMFGTGNNFSFRTARLREIGGFDPALGNGTPALGGVDSEVLLRTILCGHQIVYEPRALAHHAHRPDYEGLKRQVYAYGTGLVAYYLKTILARPRFAWDFVRKVPVGLRWMLSSEAHINEHKRADYPSELDRLERRGMLYGPLAYARSRRHYGPHRAYRGLALRPGGRRS